MSAVPGSAPTRPAPVVRSVVVRDLRRVGPFARL